VRRAAPRRQPASRVGDVVTAIDGKPIGSFSDMQRIVGIRAGEQLTFTVKRGDSTLQLRARRN
jgi:regulator of sigma E protease